MRNLDGRFVAGYSANLSGRPAVVSELQRLACAQTPAAFATIIEAMNDAASPPNARVAAAVTLLDHGYGRPSNAVVIETAAQMPSPERQAVLESFLRNIEERAARLAAAEKRTTEAEWRLAELVGIPGR